MQMAAALAIERTIDIMWDRYAEPLTLEELAAAAIFSKFYYSRVFRDLTGTSPGRFLSAIRLFMAKRQLLETGASVTEISYRVGYNSLGTFTSRFTRSVGISPARYRFLADCGMPPIDAFGMTCPGQEPASLTGQVHMCAADGPLRVYVAAFNTAVVEGLPQSCDVLERCGAFRLAVRDGEWFVRAAAVTPKGVDSGPRMGLPRLVGAALPVTVRGGQAYTTGDITLRPLGPLDLPILLALPELDSRDAPRLAGIASGMTV
jgi:AraC family transcriptional regulator